MWDSTITDEHIIYVDIDWENNSHTIGPYINTTYDQNAARTRLSQLCKIELKDTNMKLSDTNTPNSKGMMFHSRLGAKANASATRKIRPSS
jgi:hypothetical protein